LKIGVPNTLIKSYPLLELDKERIHTKSYVDLLTTSNTSKAQQTLMAQYPYWMPKTRLPWSGCIHPKHGNDVALSSPSK